MQYKHSTELMTIQKKKYSTELENRKKKSQVVMMMLHRAYAKKIILTKEYQRKKISQEKPYKIERKKKLNQTGKKNLYGKIPYRGTSEKF